jgi:2-oxoisovalerate ferredoxin oxidoreductase beta subunit
MQAAVLKKPASFYDKFVRKSRTQQETTTYCPGCGHGTLHKLIAEAIIDLGVADRTIFVSPVGCSVFAYYYFNTGNVQSAHGRAPAVATGLKRANPDSIIIVYQGDGDLAAIGGNEIVNAANRGENISVFFINNAIYGMTGGQMAPTTLIGQKTLTSPYGRNVANEGYPIRMSEIIATLDAPVYVERTALIDFKTIMKTKKAVQKALKNQIENKGFSMVEVLSTCPTNWKMEPVEAQKWLRDNMIPIFPLQVFKDKTNEVSPRIITHKEYSNAEVLTSLGLTNPEKESLPATVSTKSFPTQKVRIAGFGGQGVLSAGIVLANCAMNQTLEVTWIPSYGPEMRGGTANCSVMISKNRIGSPLTTNPNVLIVMNTPALDAFEHDVEKGGLIIVNSSIIDRKVTRDDVKVLYIPLTEIATEIGLTAAANMVCLGAYLEFTKLMDYRLLAKAIGTSLKRKNLIDINVKAVEQGVEFIQKNYPSRN